MKDLDLYKLLEDLVTSKHIHALLKRHKSDFREEIALSGKKTDLLENLKQNVHKGHIPKSEVHDLLRESEENGDQHIYYFRPKSEKVKQRCEDGEGVAKALFGADWRRTTGFPKLTRVPDSYEVVDFRIGLEKKPMDWLLKVYGFQTITKKVRQEERGGQEFAIIFKRVEIRTILVARWNSDRRIPLLELRTSRDKRPGRLPAHLSMLWTKLQKAFVESDFEPWDLNPARNKMVQESASNTKLYLANSARLNDSMEGAVSYVPYTNDEPIHSAAIRVNTIGEILDDGGRCVCLAVDWQHNDSALEETLRTFIGSRKGNELVIPAQSSLVAVDYVTNQLRYFASQAS